MPDLILQSLPYTRDSSSLLQQLAHLPGAVSLDSGLADQQEARFDVLSALPTVQLRLLFAAPGLVAPRLQTREWHDHASPWQDYQHGDCVFQAAEDLLNRHRPGNADMAALAHLPFCGGLMGYLSYNAGADALLPAVNDTLHHEFTELCAIPLAVLGCYHWAIVVDHKLRQSCCFILSDCPVVIRQQVLDLLGSLKQTALSGPAPTDAFGLQAPFRALTDRAAYTQAFGQLKDYIVAGDCYQTNLAIPFAARYSGSPSAAYQILRQHSLSPFSAWFNGEGFSVLSLSPERFVSVSDGDVCTQPIKGTRRRSADVVQDRRLAEELLASDKDRAENLMIVDLLRNDLGAVCETGSVRTQDLFKLHSFSHVHHLISTITGRLPPQTSPMVLLRQCFPGGSITGAPKIRAMQIIAELEPLPRSVYCGTIMYCDFRGRMDSNICIRTLLATASTLYCWGGGGIVADSDCEREYQECFDKVSALMSALPLADSSR